MTDAALALQKAIHVALVADAGVGAIAGDRVFDAAPRDPVFPYVTLGDIATSDWSTGTEIGAEHRLTLHAWSRGRGKAEAALLVAALEAALHDAALTLVGHVLVNLRFVAAEVRQERDGVTWHGIARFRAVTEVA